MRKIVLLFVILIAIIISIFAFFRYGHKIHDHEVPAESPSIDYYTCGMHPSVRVSPEEYNKGNVNCPICNMKLIPVYKESKVSQDKKKILFYRHPHDAAITSQAPAKDHRDMEFIPVYEGTEEAAYYGCGMEGEEHVFFIEGIKGMSCPICGMPLKQLSKSEADKLKGVVSRVEIKGKQAELAGVKTDEVKKLHLYKKIRTVGRVAYDPHLAIAEEEFISSLRAFDKIQKGRISEIKERAKRLVESARRKLRLLGLSEEQIKELEKTREVHTNFILPEKKMWIYADVYEYELSWLRLGSKVKVTTSSFPGDKFQGVVSSINPVVDANTRAVRFRAEVNNPDLKLKPEMYVDVVIESMYMSPEGKHMVLAIPKDALLDTGLRKIIWIEKNRGEYEGRIVEIGPEATASLDGKEVKHYPVISGLKQGERVVTKANFLIDSQSQISGTAAAAYGGALGKDEKKAAPIHQH